MVILQDAAKTCTAVDLSGSNADHIVRINKVIVQTLMISVRMIMLDEIGDGPFQRSLAKEDYLVQCF